MCAVFVSLCGVARVPRSWHFWGEHGGVALVALPFVKLFIFSSWVCFVCCWHMQWNRPAAPCRLPVRSAVLLYGTAVWYPAWYGVQHGTIWYTVLLYGTRYAMVFCTVRYGIQYRTVWDTGPYGMVFMFGVVSVEIPLPAGTLGERESDLGTAAAASAAVATLYCSPYFGVVRRVVEPIQRGTLRRGLGVRQICCGFVAVRDSGVVVGYGQRASFAVVDVAGKEGSIRCLAAADVLETGFALIH